MLLIEPAIINGKGVWLCDNVPYLDLGFLTDSLDDLGIRYKIGELRR
jgi:hypothetical protein